MSHIVTLDEARDIIRNAGQSYAEQCEAAAVVAASNRSELSDLMRCLHLRGVPAELAATALYTRTGRPYSGVASEFSADPEDWSRYLAGQLRAIAG